MWDVFYSFECELVCGIIVVSSSNPEGQDVFQHVIRLARGLFSGAYFTRGAGSNLSVRYVSCIGIRR